MKNIALPRTVKAPSAVIAALLMLAGILFAPPSPAVAAPLPDHLVNGDFQYPTVPDDWWIYPWGGNGDVNKRFLTINPGKAARARDAVFPPTGTTSRASTGQGSAGQARRTAEAAPVAPANRATWN